MSTLLKLETLSLTPAGNYCSPKRQTIVLNTAWIVKLREVQTSDHLHSEIKTQITDHNGNKHFLAETIDEALTKINGAQ